MKLLSFYKIYASEIKRNIQFRMLQILYKIQYISLFVVLITRFIEALLYLIDMY
jgi:hypothetical protein